MSSLIKGLNPLERARNEEEAVGAARATTVGLVIAVVWGVAAHFLSAPAIEAAQAAGTMPAMPQGAESIGLIITVAVIALQLGLAALQWFKPNLAIPVIFCLLCAFGVVSTPVVMMLKMPMPPLPMWLIYGGWAVNLVCMLLHISGWRGALALSRFRGDM